MSNASEYVVGSAHPNRQDYATLRTKPPRYLDNGRRDSGSGYERWRSTEHRPHTARRGSEDVYVPVHRLTAVVACFDTDTPLAQIFDVLDGADVHHSAPEVPEDWGIPWDNRPDCLHVVDHGTHSEVTQAQMRAWGEDAKRTAREDSPDGDRCGRCDAEADVLCTCSEWEGRYCLECAKAVNDTAPIEVV